jgi:hypothetical protein
MNQEDDLEQIVKEHQEDLQIVADANCSASWIAETILERFGMDYPQEHNDRQGNSIEGKSDTNTTESERSLLSF